MNIAALLSGGVDSSVAVHLLCEQGLKPDLFYIKIGMDDDGYSCPQEEDLEIVRAMARKYGLKHEVVDLQQEYWDQVVAYTIDKVRRGFTPNPDVMCNRLIKFGAFDQKVGHLYDKTATGHYANTIKCKSENVKFKIDSEADGCDSPYQNEWESLCANNSDFSLFPSTFLGTTPDPVKDQTDFLAQLEGWQVEHSLFPIGNMAKGEVRRIAEEAKLPSARRKDSQGICFLGKINYNEFIERFLGKKEGPIVEIETGKILGKHQGFWFHTIGQRKGLYLSGGPWFVVKKDIEQNIVYVSKGYQPEAQMKDELVMRDMHWITLDPFEVSGFRFQVSDSFKFQIVSSSKDQVSCGNELKPETLKLETLKPAPQPSLPVLFKIRHVAELRSGHLTKRTDGSYYLKMAEKTNGVAPGQFCVIYTPDARICLGSGEIAWE